MAENKKQETVQEDQPSFIDLALDQTPELSVVPPDQEYQLKIVKVTAKVSKGEATSGQNLLLFLFSLPEEPDTRMITYPVMLPSSELDEADNNDRKRQLKRVLEAFDWDVSKGFNPDELVGLTGWAVLGVESDPQYGEQNKIKAFVVPK